MKNILNKMKRIDKKIYLIVCVLFVVILTLLLNSKTIINRIRENFEKEELIEFEYETYEVSGNIGYTVVTVRNKEGIEKIINKECIATFIEGMGCSGGCIGGPKRLLSVDEGRAYIDEYSHSTNMKIPFDNLNVIQILTEMGIKRLDYLGNKEEKQITEIFNRNLKNDK